MKTKTIIIIAVLLIISLALGATAFISDRVIGQINGQAVTLYTVREVAESILAPVLTVVVAYMALRRYLDYLKSEEQEKQIEELSDKNSKLERENEILEKEFKKTYVENLRMKDQLADKSETIRQVEHANDCLKEKLEETLEAQKSPAERLKEFAAKTQDETQTWIAKFVQKIMDSDK